MFYHDSKLQYTVRVDTPQPALRQDAPAGHRRRRGRNPGDDAVPFPGLSARAAPPKYRDMLMETGTEEMGHVEMLATAVAMNLRGRAHDDG